MLTKIVAFMWNERESGCGAHVATMSEDEWKQIYSLIEWLNENGGDNIGQSLMLWEVSDSPEKAPVSGGYDFNGLVEAILDSSRYDETDPPGEFYGGRHPLLDKEMLVRQQALKQRTCKHPNAKRINLGTCWNKYECPDCGFVEVVDSSD